MSDNQPIPRIATLPAAVANQIAAGEVVERPASVVKECLENALDAGATQITIQLENAGKNLIRIADDGHGIHPEDLSLVITSHATSKIHQADDLSAIHSFGFRGEALASIASVSRFIVSSALADAEHATQLQVQDHHTEQTPIARNRGTTIEVRDLFYNTPARKKFLRANNTEYHHIVNVIKAIALSHFNCRFEVFHNAKQVFDYRQANTDFGLRISDVMGKQFLQHALAFEFQHDNMRLWGWLGLPVIARNQSDKQFLFINNRLVTDKHIQHAIRLAYQQYLFPGRFPCFVVFLELDISRVDVNVHPTKQEVRLDDARTVHDYVYLCLSQLLNDQQNQVGSVQATKTDNNIRLDNRGIREESPASYRNSDEHNSVIKNTVISGDLWQQCYAMRQTEQGWLLIDIVPTLDLLLRQHLEATPPKPFLSKPLLFPHKIERDENIIECLLSYQTQLKLLGLNIQSNSGQDLLLMSMPLCVSSMNIDGFFDQIITAPIEANDLKSLYQCMLTHCDFSFQNDEHPMLNEMFEFIKTCKSLKPASANPWRVLTEQDLAQFLS